MILFLLFFLLGYNDASIGMAVHKGIEFTCIEPTIIQNKIWKECIVMCAKNETCVAAQVFSGAPRVCKLCDIKRLQSLRYFGSYQNQIALKSSTSLQKSCNLFEKGKFTGTFNNTSGLTQYSYTTQLSKDGRSWTYFYNVTRRCPLHWKRFNRTLGDWCIKLMAETYTPSQKNATRLCAAKGAVLSGLESQAETDYIQSNAIDQLNIGDSLATVWVDGIRRKGCQINGQKSFPPGCDGLNGFNFIDTLLSDKAGYKWEPNNPDGLELVGTGVYQDCLALWIQPNNKLIDDTICDPALTNDKAVKGYVCGKEPGY